MKINSNNEVWVWGNNSCGQLGLGHSLDMAQPAKVAQLSDKRVIKVSGGKDHTLALTASSQVSEKTRV